ncbi:hypothetical protein CAL7716_085720 [Calothrix sp. PCC 7716]|nr:hypothetical protein CAL7716_085720 [Calothrix sp. PCC 7716]
MTQTIIDNQAAPKASLNASSVTCASCPYFQSHNDGTNKGWCGLFDHFARETHLQTQDCVNTIRDEQAEVEQQVEELPEPYEIDSEEHAQHGEVFRLWKGWQFAGSFYETRDGKWIAEPMLATINGRFSTSENAILILITIFENPELQQVA